MPCTSDIQDERQVLWSSFGTADFQRKDFVRYDTIYTCHIVCYSWMCKHLKPMSAMVKMHELQKPS